MQTTTSALTVASAHPHSSLDDVIRSGKALYVGISDSPAWKVAQCNTLAQLRGWSPFIGLATQYSLIERTAERDLLPMCEDMNVGCMPWGVLNQGLLSGKYAGAQATVPGWCRDAGSTRH